MASYWETRARQIAAEEGINPDIFARQIGQESGFNPAARSPAGAAGIAQLMPVHWSAVDPWDPEAALRYAARLMRSHLERYGGDYAKALAAYSAGTGSVDRWLQQYGADWTRGIFDETRTYLNRILGGVEAAPQPVGRRAIANPAEELRRFREYVGGRLGGVRDDGGTAPESPERQAARFLAGYQQGLQQTRQRQRERMASILNE